MASNLIGKVILNQYRVDAFIASGGMGAVYKVWDLNRNVFLAMKVLHDDYVDDPVVLKSFKREANALKKITHPNIVPFYGVEIVRGFAFLLAKYIDGPSLKTILIERGQPLSIIESLTFLKAVSAALGFAHRNGVVHCDVKPGNVMVDQGGGIYLADFGIARHAESTRTSFGGTVGTFSYMAPEQFRDEVVTKRTDVYGLGIMLYEMLTGQRPFTGTERESESVGETLRNRMMYAQLQLTPPDPRSINSNIPKELSAVVLKALAKDPNNRYHAMDDFFKAACDSVGINPRDVPERFHFPQSEQLAPAIPPPPPKNRWWDRLSGMWIIISVIGIAVVFLIIANFTGMISFPRGQATARYTETIEISQNIISENESDGKENVVATTKPVSDVSKEEIPTITRISSATPMPSKIVNTPSPTSTPTPIIEPIIVEPYCDMLEESPVYVNEHQPIILKWRWDAATQSQVRDHIRAATYRIFLDGKLIEAASQSEINFLSDKGWYQVVWYSDPISISRGTHKAERYLSWSEKIFDGWNWFGPGGDTESEYHYCEIIVR